jgi:hypothetical protein
MPAHKMVKAKKFGGTLGSVLGSLGSMLFPIPGIDGGALGHTLGSLLPFRRGGKAKKRKVAKRAPARKRGGK